MKLIATKTSSPLTKAFVRAYNVGNRELARRILKLKQYENNRNQRTNP